MNSYLRTNNRLTGFFFQGLLLLTVLLTLTVVSGFAQASAPTPTPSDEELKLQEQKRLLELQRDIEQAKKAIRDAQPQAAKPPEPSATPLTGDTTLSEGVRLETEMVSYKAMAEAAKTLVQDIGDRLKDDNNNKIIIKNLAIYDAQIVKDWRFYQALFPAFRGQVEDLLTNYKDILCDDHSGVDQHFRETYCVKQDAQRFALRERANVAKFGTEAISSALAVGGNFVKSFIDFAALFRTETKIEGKTVTIDQNALIAEVFRQFRNTYGQKQHAINLYYPALFPPRLEGTEAIPSETIKHVGLLYIFKSVADELIKAKTEEEKPLAKTKNDKVQKKQELENQLAQVKTLTQQLDNLNAALALESVWIFRKKLWEEKANIIAKLGTMPSQTDLDTAIKKLKAEIKQIQDQIDLIDETIGPLAELNERFQRFVDDFIEVDANGMNALALFIKSEDLQNAMKATESYWLEIKSVSAGGNNRTRKNLIWYFAGARVDHSGGVILEYTLYNRSGAVVASDKLSHYDGYIKPKDLRSEKFKDP